MSLKFFLTLGSRARALKMSRRLHDRKLPQVMENFMNEKKDSKMIGTESPRKIDQSSFQHNVTVETEMHKHHDWDSKINTNPYNLKDPFNDRED
tara:strand:+ start:145 stop:426 length:282 start_codon:yes stop_codon:yes gene_type:complete